VSLTTFKLMGYYSFFRAHAMRHVPLHAQLGRLFGTRE